MEKYKKVYVAVIAALLLLIAALVGVIISDRKNLAKSETVTEAQKTEEKDTENEQNTEKTEADDGADEKSTEKQEKTVSRESRILDTGNLTAAGSGYEGTEGTGSYNYGEALQKSLLFYELQRSGRLPDKVRCNWRSDSALSDGEDNGVDLTGGWYDAGDHVKFNLPMAYSGAMLAWSYYEDKAAYEESGQEEYMLGNLRWVSEYLIKCHTAKDEFYYQVGDGGADHSWWGSAEVMRMDRPSYKVTKDSPGSAVTAEAAACLAASSMAFADKDKAFSDEMLSHARELFEFADSTRSDDGYTAANGFYNSWSGFYDELAWAGAWLYLATGDEAYLTKAEECYSKAGDEYKWAVCWDDVHIAAAVLLSRITEKDTYIKAVEKNLDYWTTGTADGERITYTPKGLAWLDSWGSLRYATTMGFVASVYSQWEGCDKAKKDTYWDFAVSQADYALGSTGFSYEIGFGDSYPVHPHHRTSQGSYSNNMSEPADARHILYGALVGGPDASDNYTDEVSNYNTNEVACDYNAGFTGLLARLYSVYHGQTLKDFGAVEPVTIDEYKVEAGINVDGQDFIEIKAYIINQTAWPARTADNLEFRYYVDLSEVYEAGGTAGNITISQNYMAGGTVEGLKCLDSEKHLYYLSVVFDDSLYPGGQEHYKKEIQVRLKNDLGVWDNSNDPSFEGLGAPGQVKPAENTALYENGNLCYGREMANGEGAGEVVSEAPGTGNGQTEEGANEEAGQKSGESASGENMDVKVSYNGGSEAVSGTLEIKNTGDAVELKDLEIDYYMNADGKTLTFDCYHTSITSAGGSYKGLDNPKAEIEAVKDNDSADTVIRIIYDGKDSFSANDTLTINFSIHSSDWSAINTSNDHSRKSVENIVIRSGEDIIFGNEPSAE